MALDFDRIREAHDRIRPHIHLTPVLTSARLDAACGGRLHFKCENFQKAGAFKSRGAVNAVFSLSDAVARNGVATHSSGNHAAALARAAGLRSIPAHIVMPANSLRAKVRAVEGYGGRIVFCAPNQTARETACVGIVAQTGATLVHPFENEDVMAGQGTVALEFLEAVPDLDVLLCPVGGGGLLAGTAVAAKHLRPDIQVIAVEPALADDTAVSFRAGHLVPRPTQNTIADGLRTLIGEPNLEIALRLVDDVVTVGEESITAAMRLLWESLRIVVEPSAAVVYAAFLESRIPTSSRRFGLILTGGNVDLDALPWQPSRR